MSARVLDGRAVARELRAGVAARVAAFGARHGRAPGLGVLIASDDEAVRSYARSKARAAERVGMGHEEVALGDDADTAAVLAGLAELTASPTIDGVIVELPLPRHVDAARVWPALDPGRDADGAHPDNLGRLAAGQPGPRPATALSVMALLEAAGTPLAGARAVVVGRSRSVGLPVALMLLARDATVTVAHSRTRELRRVTRTADVLVVAAGVPGLLGADDIRAGATVIDVGTNWVADEREPDGGRLVGDVRFDEGCTAAGVMTPVPGGVGPVTTAHLLATVVDLAERRASGA